jgi:50S ribosomal protein L16 3-hydroxylase
MLYLPARVAHHGVAQNVCMTYSVGFRANSYKELVDSFTDHLVNTTIPDMRYNATDFQSHPGQITSDSIQQIKKILLSSIQIDNSHIEQWFGQFITEPKLELELDLNEPLDSTDELKDILSDTEFLYRHPAIRFAFINQLDHSLLFVNGETYSINQELAECLCDKRHINCQQLLGTIKNKDEFDIVFELYDKSFLVINE